MTEIRFTLNGKARTFTGDADMPLLWYVRDHAALRGTKYGCGIGQCGACTLHIDGEAVRSCSITMDALKGADVVTIEGLSKDGTTLHPVQEAWIEEDVSQCGYCQAGQVMAAVAFLSENPDPTGVDIEENITNLCRCGTYPRIQQAILKASDKVKNTR